MPALAVLGAIASSHACVADAAEPGPAVSVAAILDGEPSIGWRNVVRVGTECSGVMIHPELVVYAAHCGAGAHAIELGDRVATASRCRAHPEADFFGTDIAYCRLDEPSAWDDIVAPISGCEVDALMPGADLTIVGFGETSVGRGGGVRREAVATLTELGEELAVQRRGVGTCAGDSGGGAFIHVDEAAWRLAGVLSSGQTADCNDGPSYFTPIWPFLSWIEQESGLDVTPCGSAEGTWDPTPACRDHAQIDGSRTGSDALSQTCGPAALASSQDAGLDPAAGAQSCNIGAGQAAGGAVARSVLLVAAGVFIRRATRSRRRRDGRELCARACRAYDHSWRACGGSHEDLAQWLDADQGNVL